MYPHFFANCLLGVGLVTIPGHNHLYSKTWPSLRAAGQLASVATARAVAVRRADSKLIYLRSR